MVERDPPTKNNSECDVKDDPVANGRGSKDLELANVRTIKGIQKVPYDPEKADTEKADFERAIELTGYGKFHYCLLGVCGFVSTSEEMDVVSMSFILPSAQCDLDLNTQAKGWLNSIIFIGMMAGAYFWGSVADAIGRRRVLIIISFMNALCIVLSSFSQSYEMFLVFRFLNGAALGGSGPVIFSYFAEFQPKAKRGSMLSFMAAFWTLGNLFVAGLAWLVIPHHIGIFTETFSYNSWRIFLLICSVPSFVVASLLFLLPESPKFLVSKNRKEEAMEIFRTIYSINTGNDKEQYPVKHLIVEEGVSKETQATEPPLIEKCKMVFRDVISNSKQLFVTPILRFTLISITINFTFHIGYYGLMMWFPELFNRFDKYFKDNPTETSASVCVVTEYATSHGGQEVTNVCDSNIPESVFIESLITVAAALPSNVLAVLTMDLLGRKFYLLFSTFASGVCAACMYFVSTSNHNLIASAVFSSIITCGNAALDCLITEIFPTNLRATGVAISMVAARMGGIIGNIVIATLLDTYCLAPTFIVAALLIGGGLLCLFLPNTTRAPLS